MILSPLRSLVLLVVLAGCSLGPNYERPGAASPVAFRETAPDAPVWPSAQWWHGFHSAELDGLIAEAEGGNFDIQAAIARIRQADAQVRISGAALLPTIDLVGKDSWQQNTSKTNSFSANGIANSTRTLTTRLSNVQASASYEVDVWGRVRATRDSAVAGALFSRYDQQTVALTAISSVATTWFSALAYQDRLAVARRNLDDAEQILKAINARLEAGTASELDVAQQGALVAGIRAQIPSFRSNVQVQLNGLGVLVGRAPQDITARPGTLNTLELPEVAPGLPSELLLRRPDVAAAEANLIAANANIRVARANFYPVIQLTAAGGFENAALGALFGPGSLLTSAAASATQKIFDNGQLDAQFDQAQARYDELVADYRKAVVQAFTDVENALTQYRFATEQEELERQAVAIAQRAADIARAQVLAGTSDIVTALQAQSTLFNDLDNLAQVRLSRFQALVALYKALGGGWSVSDTVNPPPSLFQGVL
jgi:NodT family efflux transporter outer membrane factor (OMF) lipoprotein